MSKQDFRDVLRAFKEDNYQEELQIDSMRYLENINPQLSSTSKSYKEGNKYLFKQPISYDNAEAIINRLGNYKKYKVQDIEEFKDEIRKKASLIILVGQSPTEMLIYGTKLFSDNPTFVNCIMDELIDLRYRDSYFVDAYRNILTNWNWNKQLLLCVKSIVSMHMTEFNDELYRLFESNAVIRQEVALALIDLGANKYYGGIINVLIALLNDSESREIKDMARTIFYYLGKKSIDGSTYIYANYLKAGFLSNEVRNIMAVGMKVNVTTEMIRDMDKRLKSETTVGQEQVKLIRLLGRLKDRNEGCRNLLLSVKDLNHINKTEIINAIGDEGEDLETLINNEDAPIKQRMNAIINLGKSKNENSERLIRNIKTEDNLLKIAIHSALFEKGNEKEIVNIFQYIIAPNSSEIELEEAKNQIKRLRGLQNPNLLATLLKVVNKILEDDKNKARVLTVLDLYSSGIADEEVGKVFLKKLKNTNINEARLKLMDFFNANITRFSLELQKAVRDEFVKCSIDPDNQIKAKALKCLKDINKNRDFIPY